MTDRPWFDQETGTLLLDEYVVEMDSYRRIVEDETITDAELVVGYRPVFDYPSVGVHLDYVFVEQQGAGLLIEPRFIHNKK